MFERTKSARGSLSDVGHLAALEAARRIATGYLSFRNRQTTRPKVCTRCPPAIGAFISVLIAAAALLQSSSEVND
jgi:hypothetical protein